MNKDIGNVTALDTEIAPGSAELSSHEALLKENAVLFDYLHALLIPPPKVNSEGGKVSFVYTPPENDANFSAANPVVENFINLESTWAKGESQGLRHENGILKLKVAHLIAQLNDTECNLDSSLAENRRLKSTIDNLQTQLRISRLIAKSHRDISEIKAKSAALQAHEAPALVVEQTIEQGPDAETDPIIPQVLDEFASDLEEILELELVVQDDQVVMQDGQMVMLEDQVVVQNDEIDEGLGQNLTDMEFAVPQTMSVMASDAVVKPELQPDASYQTRTTTLPESAMGAQTVVREGLAGSRVEPDRAAVAPAAASVGTPQEADREPAAPSKQSLLMTKPAHRPSHSSKVIKRQDVKKHRPPQEAAAKVSTAAPQPAIQQPKPDLVRKQIPVQPFIVEPEAKHEVEPVSGVDLLQTGVDGIEVEPAPVPKALVKRQMMHYKQNQEEADSAEAGAAQAHDIVRL